MKILLTGATGFLGAYVLECLVRRGIETLCIGRNRPELDAAVDYVAVDLLEKPNILQLCQKTGVTHLLHLAWYTEHGRYWSSPLNLRWSEASVHLVEEFCLAGGRRVVVAGTCAEYDWAYGYCKEDLTPLKPATSYGIAKDATRRLIGSVCEGHGATCSWGRVFQPYGKGESDERLIPSLIRVFRGCQEPFGVNADAYRDFIHASDVAEGFVTLLLSDVQGAYNISSGEPIKIGDVVVMLGLGCDADPSVVLDLASNRNDAPKLLLGDSSKLRELGWVPRTPFREGLVDLLNH
ncbi:NAD-dependent epimerase/dehydratase family protein [Imhoffiella purpurea]|uniref:UDP-glucose 4-epimerase n=1 Tax=Imhoffiella purpurea TaxID=1249627 RepID=W9W2X5_9GAMM|nr:NAD(P)-dependent oxidoreductase [Imhoffiella purpurea]EXJ16920.1 UDP-glucose 4-epimerase [Imhoffiella purpurea]